MLADALTKALCEVKFAKFAISVLVQEHESIRAGVLTIQQLLLNSCSSKRMQGECKQNIKQIQAGVVRKHGMNRFGRRRVEGRFPVADNISSLDHHYLDETVIL
jgi:hypothetical protein